jgi:hypothetical protein
MSRPNTPAKAGLEVGDIVEAVANNEIDQNGNHIDPLYGKIEFTNLLTAHTLLRDVVPFRIQRSGKPMQLNADASTSRRQRLRQPALQSRTATPYYVLGGSFFRNYPANISRNGGRLGKEKRPSALFILTVSNRNSFQKGTAALSSSARFSPPTVQSVTMKLLI